MHRDIGPIGTATRIMGGIAAIAIPIALEGIGWWDVGVALVALPLTALAAGEAVTSVSERYSPESLGRREAICSGPACWTWAIVIAIAIILAALTPTTMVAFWTWLGASLLLAAGRGYAGCELLAFPNLIRGRRERIGCMLYGPIDAYEARRRAGA